jgi:NitT/TauT family transport system permease protein
LIAQHSSPSTDRQAERGAVHLDNVSVEFKAAGVLAVDKFSLSVKPGEFVSIVGPSGCGKTTLLNYAAGLLPAFVCSGTFLVGGKPPTLTSILTAFVFGSAGGILVGMLFITRPNIEALMSPIMLALNSMPRIALAPLFLIWFGLGTGSKIALGFSLTFFIVLTNTVAGGRGVNPDHITLARTLGASESQIFSKFVLPSAVPVIFNGLRLGLIFALLGVIGSEIFASDHGIGQILALYGASFKTNSVFGIIFMLAAIGVGINLGMTALENRLLRWR